MLKLENQDMNFVNFNDTLYYMLYRHFALKNM